MHDFTVVLPGCRVMGQRLSNGEYLICGIEASGDYQAEQEARLRPGLYRATKSASSDARWRTQLKADGRVTSKDGRNTVAIADSGYKDPDEAAYYLSARVKKTVAPDSEEKGYDLFYIPGKRRLAGLINYRQAIRAERDKSLHEAAYALTEIMTTSQQIDNVMWFAEFGGSALLTQAMRNAKDRGLQLPKHKMHLYRPTARKDIAYGLSQDLGMRVERDFVTQNWFNINELIGAGSLTLPWRRYRRESSHDFVDMSTDYVKMGANANNLYKAASSAITVAALNTAAFPATTTVIAALISAVTVVSANMPNTTDRLLNRK